MSDNRGLPDTMVCEGFCQRSRQSSDDNGQLKEITLKRGS